MKQSVTLKQAKRFLGKHIVATKQDGTIVSGKLLRISGNRLVLEREKGKKVHTKAIIPLVLFDLLAIGTAPFAYGYGYGGVPYGGYGAGYGGYPGAYPYGGFY